MGKTFCPPSNHPELHRSQVETCWGCDRCPKQHAFRLGHGSYCPDCRADYQRRGFPWCAVCANYHFTGRPAHDPAGRIIEAVPDLGLDGYVRVVPEDAVVLERLFEMKDEEIA